MGQKARPRVGMQVTQAHVLFRALVGNQHVTRNDTFFRRSQPKRRTLHRIVYNTPKTSQSLHAPFTRATLAHPVDKLKSRDFSLSRTLVGSAVRSLTLNARRRSKHRCRLRADEKCSCSLHLLIFVLPRPTVFSVFPPATGYPCSHHLLVFVLPPPTVFSCSHHLLVFVFPPPGC